MSWTIASLLAAYTAADQRELIFYLSLIVAAAGVVVVVALVIRKLTMRSTIDHDPFTLHDLRRMHGEGELSDEEFEAAHRLIVAKNKAQFNISAPPAPPGTDPDEPASGYRKKNFPDESDKDPGDDPSAGFKV